MRTMILLALVLSSFSFGVTSDSKRLCDQVARGNSFLGQQCYDAIGSKLFEAGAVEGCTSINNDFLVIECLKATAMKKYSSDEISRCSNNSNGFLLVDCFKKAGANACR